MRLLKFQENLDDFSLVDFSLVNFNPVKDRQNIRYAILSHTWGEDNEEVTYKDMVEGTGKNKVGFEKLRFCARQAKEDGLQHIWVDTCCIDKSSSAELTEAINSMFYWYQNATKCYAYLIDVSTNDDAFEKSKWFTRGWTLQELLAPESVEFFDRNGKPLGDRVTRLQDIRKATGISVLALQGYPMYFFDVYERIAWSKGRETSRVEDIAYSLLGLCDVQISLIYGEGHRGAFRRLLKEVEENAAGQPPNDFVFKFVRNHWPWNVCKPQKLSESQTDIETKQFPKRGIHLGEHMSDKAWHNRHKRIRWAAELLRGFSAIILFVWPVFSSAMLEHTSAPPLARFCWDVGNLCGCVVGMRLLYRQKWNPHGETYWGHFKAMCRTHIVVLLLAALVRQQPHRESGSTTTFHRRARAQPQPPRTRQPTSRLQPPTARPR